MLRNIAASIRRLWDGTDSKKGLRDRTLLRWVLSFPLSARVTFLVGVALAALAAGEQIQQIVVRAEESGTDRSFDPGDWRAVGILLLSLALAAAASWYGLDQRTLSRWSGVLSDLRAELTELESVHPDVLAAVLRSVHPEARAAELERALHSAVKELSQELSSTNRAPSQAAVDAVKDAAEAATALGPIPGNGDADWMGGDSADVSAAWAAMIRLRAVASTTTEEFNQPTLEAPTPGKESGALPEGSTVGTSWGQVIPLATLLVGLVATPALAGAITDPSTPTTEPATTTTTTTEPTATTEPKSTTTSFGTTTSRQPTTTTAEVPRRGNLTEEEAKELQDLFVDGSIPLSDSLTAAVVEASDFDCAGFYQAIIDIHRDHKSLPEALTKSPYWELASRWCGDGNLIIEQLKDIGR